MWVTILAAPRASETLLLLPHCLSSWVATCPGQRGSAKHCVIRRGRAGLGGGQEERARRTGGRKSGSRSPLPPQRRATPQVPAAFPLSTETPPCSAPITAQSMAELGDPATTLGGMWVPVTGSSPRVCVPARALLCTGSGEGRGKSVPAFPRLCTVPLLAGSSAGEEER